MWWQFKSAFVRKLAYIAAAAFVMVLFGHRSYSQASGCYAWTSASGIQSQAVWTGSTQSAMIAAQGVVALLNCREYASDGTTCKGGTTVTSCSVSAPSATAQSSTCIGHYDDGTGYQEDDPIYVSATQLTVCPAGCSAAAGQYNYMALNTGFVSPGGNICAADGCSYNASTMNANRQALVVNDPTTLQVMISTGQSCASSANAPTPVSTVTPSTVSDACTSGGGNSLCMQTSANGSGSETINGTLTVVPSQVQPGTCVAAGGGGAACSPATGSSTVQTPPGPDNGTPGIPATPIAQIQEGANTVSVYSAAQVVGSKTPVTTGSGLNTSTGSTTGSGTGTGTGTSGTGSGSDTNSDAADGGADCTTPPTCSGDAISCAILNQQWLDRCASTDAGAVASAVALGDGEQVAASSSDQSTVITETGYVTGGASSCPAPPTVTIFGTSMTFDFLMFICSFALQIAPIVMVVAYLYAAKIWLGSLLA